MPTVWSCRQGIHSLSVVVVGRLSALRWGGSTVYHAYINESASILSIMVISCAFLCELEKSRRLWSHFSVAI